MKRILWPIGSISEANYVLRILKKLEKLSEIDTTFVTDIRVTAKTLAGQKQTYHTLGQLFERAAADIPTNKDELIAKANALISGIDINMIVHADHFAKMTMPLEAAQILAAKAVVAYDWLFRNQKFDYLVRYGGNNINFWVPSILAEKHGIPCHVLISCGLFDRCGLQPSGMIEQWDWNRFAREWPLAQKQKVSEEDKAKIDEMILNYVSNHARAPRSRLTGFREVFKQKNWKAKWKFWKGEIRAFLNLEPKVLPDIEGYLRDPDLRKMEVIYNNHMQEYHRKWQSGHSKFVYDEIPKNFIYFPLNQPNDAPHRCWNPMVFLQEHIATVAYHSLPAGVELVVKEHPYSSGLPSYEELIRLQKLGVKVVHPNEHSLELVKKCIAVFCVGDTTGWEAIMLNRPGIIYCAKPFYRQYPFTFSVSDPNELHHVFRQVAHMPPLTSAEQEQRYTFLKATFDSGYPGNIWSYKGLIWSKKDDSDENLDLVVNMLHHEIGAGRAPVASL